jgi:hypothetical protein
MVTDTTLAADATGGVGAGGVATGVGEVGDEPQAIDKARITTPNESLLIIFNSRRGPTTRTVATSAYCWPVGERPPGPLLFSSLCLVSVKHSDGLRRLADSRLP